MAEATSETSTTTTTTEQAPTSGTPGQPTITPAIAAPSLLGIKPASEEKPTTTTETKVEMPAGFEGGADAWAKLDDAGKTAAVTAATEKAKGESAARVEAWSKAEGKDAKLAAWKALSPDEQKAQWKDMPDAVKTELGITDPSRPTYTEFTLPEGLKADAGSLKPAIDLFADAGLTQEQAQKFVDLAASRELAAVNAPLKAYVDLQNGWLSEIQKDPDVGGDKFKASMAAAGRAIDRLGGDDLREAMNLTGAGNNPRIFKAFVTLGQWLSEDKFRPGNPPAGNTQKTAADRMYPDLPSGS